MRNSINTLMAEQTGQSMAELEIVRQIISQSKERLVW